MPPSVNKRSSRQIVTAEKRKQVVALRRKHMTFEEIGAALDPPISAVAAFNHYRKALALIPAHDVEEHRREDNALADDAIRSLLEIVERTKVGAPRTAVEAWKAACSWAERKAKLNGTDAPLSLRADLSMAPAESIEAAIAKLESELGQHRHRAAITAPPAVITPPSPAAIEAPLETADQDYGPGEPGEPEQDQVPERGQQQVSEPLPGWHHHERVTNWG
jgi:hypothetical protein